MPDQEDSGKSRWFLALLILGAAIRIAVLPLPGTIDVQTQKLWSYGASSDVTGIYGVGGTPPERRVVRWLDISGPVDYPPIALYELAVVGRTYRAIDPAYPDSPLLTVLIKMPGLLAEILFVAMVLTVGRRLFDRRTAQWTAIAFWINPAIWFTGAGLGYVDAQGAVPAAAALLAATMGRPAVAGTLVAIAAGTKPQTVFLVPIVAALLSGSPGQRRWRSLGVAAVSAAVTTAIVIAPFMLRGAWSNVVQGVSRLLHHDMLSGNAANLGWIATWGLRVWHAAPDIGWTAALAIDTRILQISRVVELGYPNPRAVGTALLVASVIWATWRASRGVSASAAAAIGAWTIYAYTIVGIPVHENHFYPAVPLLGLAAATLHSLRAIYWASSAIFALNIYLFYGLGAGHPSVIGRSWTFIDFTVLLAAVNIGVFVWLTRTVRRVDVWTDG